MKNNRYLICCAAFLSALFFTTIAQGQVITTVAGTATMGFTTTGPATAVTMTLNYGIVCDGSGNLYIAEEGGTYPFPMGSTTYYGMQVQQLTAGNMTTVAGVATSTVTATGDGGPAASATLYSPVDVAVDGTGNLYIADNAHDRVRMVNASTHIITTIAGNGGTGAPYGNGGPATAAHINPRGIVSSITGDTIYVSDGYEVAGATNCQVRILTGSPSTGVYTINNFAGTGLTTPFTDGVAATAATLNAPRGLFLDAAGNLYIADMTNNRIRMVSAATGLISTVAGSAAPAGFGGDGMAATAAATKLSGPTDVVVDGSGNMYIADAGNNRVRYVTGGIITTIAGDNINVPSPYGDGGPATAAYLSAPVSIALDPTPGNAGNYYISDQTHTKIRYVNVSVAANNPPTFVNGANQNLVVCENSAATALNTDLEVNDPDVGNTETWTLTATPGHGTAVVAYTTTSTGSTLTPTGLSYTPTTGFSGTDAFTVKISDGTASNTTTIHVTVNPLPVVAAIGGAGTASICVGANLNLTETTTGGTWAAANANADVTGGTVTGLAAGTDIIYYSKSNTCGTDTVSQTVTVNANVVPSVTVSSSLGTSACGVAGTFTAIPVNGGASPAYQWTVNSMAPPTGGTSASYTYTPATGDIVAVQLTSNAACASPAVATGSITMSGTASVVPAISISSGIGDTLCIGVPVTFTSIIANGGVSPGYQWTVNGSVLGTASTFTFVPTASSAGAIIQSTLTSSIPCAVPTTATSAPITVYIRSASTSSLHISASPSGNICAGTDVTFTAAETGGGSSPAYRWTRAGINVATGPSYTCAPSDGDVVYCTMHSSIACSPTDSVLSNSITVAAEPAVAPVVTISSSQTITSAGQDVIFTATVTSATPTPTYQWYVNGYAIPGSTSNFFIFNDDTVGTAVVNCAVGSGNACNTTGISNFVSMMIASEGVQQTGVVNSEMKLMPNPNKGVFTMNLTSGYNEPVSVVITNVLGEKVKEMSTTTNNTTEIKLDQAPGIYFLSATTDHGRYVAKIMVN